MTAPEPQVVNPFAAPPAAPEVAPFPEVVAEPRAPRRTVRYLLAGLLALVLIAGVGLAVLWLRPSANRPGERPAAAAAPSPTDTPSPVESSPTASPSPSPSASRSASPSRSVSSAPVDPNLVADEEFTGPLDPTRWDVYSSTHPNGATWTPAMVSAVGGELRIASAGRNPTGAGNASGGLCWCAGTLGNRVYGRWVVRARFEAGAGYAPVIGLWPQSDKGTEGAIGFADAHAADRKTLSGYLTGPAGNPTFFQRTLAGDFTAWHLYSVEWRAAYVRMWVDGKLFYDSSTQPGVVPPAVPMHIYLQEVPGPGDGVPPANAQTPASVTMHVDWIHVYR